MKNKIISLNIFELSEEFRRDPKKEFELAIVIESSVFEILRLDCIKSECQTTKYSA